MSSPPYPENTGTGSCVKGPASLENTTPAQMVPPLHFSFHPHLPAFHAGPEHHRGTSAQCGFSHKPPKHPRLCGVTQEHPGYHSRGGRMGSVQLLPCPVNEALWTCSRCKLIFDITQHDNFFRVAETQSIQINLSAETISLFIRICTLHLLRPRALPEPWS